MQAAMNIVSEDGVPFTEPPKTRGLDFFGRWEGYPGLNTFTIRCGACGTMLLIPNEGVGSEDALRIFAREGVLIEDSRVRCATCQPGDAAPDDSGA